MIEVSANLAMVILMNADPDFEVPEPEEYQEARNFARCLAGATRGVKVKHKRSGFVFSISGRE